LLELEKFVGWLSFHPPVEYIARSIVTEYLVPYHPTRCHISRLRTNDSVQVLSSFGPDIEEAGNVSSGSQWRQWCQENLTTKGHEVGPWSKDVTQLVLPLRDHGAIQGFIHIAFDEAIDESIQAEVEAKVSALAAALDLYFSLLSVFKGNGAKQKEFSDEHFAGQEQGDASSLTARQMKILTAMVEAKTNHEIAEELGFSISTVRQETMKIYKVLGVTDRRAAAQKAMELNLA
jgi:DNA-binding CsgD family transcriptional regulator